jgi:outer membrane protein
MRKVSLFVVVAVLFFLPSALTAQTLNIVYVDIQRVMAESDKGKEELSAFNVEKEKLRIILDNKQKELSKLKDDIDKQSATITADARAEKGRVLQNKAKDFQRLADEYNEDLKQKYEQITGKLLMDLEEVIKTVGDRDKYSIILERRIPGFLYGAQSLDITNKVLSLYNEMAKKKTIKK